MNHSHPLRVSRFDAVTSALMTLMLFAAAVTGGLMLLWLVSRFETPSHGTVVVPSTIASGNFQRATNLQSGFVQPGNHEFEALIKPSLADSVQVITTEASRVAGAFSSHGVSSGVTSNGDSIGNSRPPGPAVDGEDMIPRSKRWQLNFTAKDQLAYAKQLDFFQIELGVIGGDVVGLDIVNNLAGNPQSRRLDDASTEKRLYFMFKRPSLLMHFERAIHHRAGVDLQGREMCKLIPPSLENSLAKIELDYSISKGHPSITEVAKTVFEVMPGSAGFEFQVVSQRYRSMR